MTKNTNPKSLILFYILSCLINGQSQPDFLGYWTGQEDLESESLTYENRNISLDINEGGVREGFYVFSSSCDLLYNSNLNWAYHYFGFDKENNKIIFLRRFVTPVGILGYEELVYDILEWSDNYFLAAYSTENRETSHHMRLDIQLLDLFDLVPAKINLSQNYPNPFNPNTNFEVSVDNNVNGELIIYDQMGSEVMVLHNGILNRGVNHFSWNGSNAFGQKVASGTYLYCLKINDILIKSQKMIYIK